MAEPARDNAPWLQAGWPAPRGVHALTTLRHGAGSSLPPFDHFNLGNRSAAEGDDPAVVEANRLQLAQLAGLPSWPHWLRQVHGTGVFHARAPAQPLAAAEEPVADAAVTAVPGVVLAILTADCLPVLLAVRDGSEVAAAHAGWRACPRRRTGCARCMAPAYCALTRLPWRRPPMASRWPMPR